MKHLLRISWGYVIWILLLIAGFIPSFASANIAGTCISGAPVNIYSPVDGQTVHGTITVTADGCRIGNYISFGKRSIDHVSTCSQVTSRVTQGNVGSSGPWDTTVATSIWGDGNDYCLRMDSFGSSLGYVSNLTIDNTVLINSVHIWSNSVVSGSSTIGDLITVSFTGGETLTGVGATIGGIGASVTNITGNTRKATITGTSDMPVGSLPFTLAVSDLLGNYTYVTGTTDNSFVNYTKVVPFLTSAHIASSNANSGYAKAGDVITLTFTSNVPLTGIVMTLANTAVTPLSGVATVTLFSGRSDGPIPFAMVFQSMSGIAVTGTVTTTSDGSSILYDNTPPVIHEITGVTSPTLNRTPSYTFSGNETGTITSVSGTPYTGTAAINGTTTVRSGNNTILFNLLPAGSYSIVITVKDLAGNLQIFPLTTFVITSPVNTGNIGWGGSAGGSSHGVFTPVITSPLTPPVVITPTIPVVTPVITPVAVPAMRTLIDTLPVAWKTKISHVICGFIGQIAAQKSSRIAGIRAYMCR